MKIELHTKFKKNPLSTAICALLVAPSFVIGASYAQENESQQTKEEEIEQIQIFARKRGEAPKDVPVSVSAMSNESLQNAGVTDISDLFALIPGIENNSSAGRISQKPSIRGVGATENASIRAKVTSFIDGIPMVGAQGIGSFSGLQHVEVLRGPQSAAFGRSTFGGAINYITADPDTYGDFELDFRATLGENDTRNLSGMMSTALIEEVLAVSIGLESKHYGGADDWVTTSGVSLGGTSDTLGSIKLIYEPTENVKVEMLYLNQDIDDEAPASTFANHDQLQAHPLNPTGLCNALDGPSGTSCVILGEIDTPEQIFDYNFDSANNPILNPGTRIKRERLQGSIEVEFESGLTLTALGAVTEEEGDSWFDNDGFSSVTNIHTSASPESDETYGEVRLASPGENDFNWLIGASIYEYDYLNTIHSNRTAGAIMDIFAESAENIGVFFSLGYSITDKLTASFEGRYQIDEISSVYPANPERGAPEDIEQASETTSFQPRLALSYELNDENNLYMQLAQGTNPAGFNVSALDPIKLAAAADENYDLAAFTTYEEEKINSIEVGVKGDLREYDFSYSVALYYLDWEGYVQPVTGNWTPGDGEFLPGTTSDDYFSRLFINTGDLDGMGLEFEGQWQPTTELTLGGSFAYNGLEFKESSCSPIPLDYGVPATSTEPFACAATIGGNTPSMLSKITGALTATYTKAINSTLDGYSRVDYQYNSKRYTEQINTDYLPAYSMVNFRAGVRAEDWSAEFYVNNLFDEDSPSGAVRFFDGRIAGMGYNTGLLMRQPRTAGINLTYNY
jgi:iron complex outermembrane receptor protein